MTLKLLGYLNKPEKLFGNDMFWSLHKSMESWWSWKLPNCATLIKLWSYICDHFFWRYAAQNFGIVMAKSTKLTIVNKGVAEREPVTRRREGGGLAEVWDSFLDFCITQCPMPVSHVWSYICLQVLVNLCLISLYMHELWFCAKILNISEL